MQYFLQWLRSIQISLLSTAHPVQDMNDTALFRTLLALLIVACGMQHPSISKAAIPGHSSAPLSDDRKSIIIHPDHFAAAARAFAFLHREFGGIEAELVPLSAIREKTTAGPSLRRIPFAGWDQRDAGHGDIRGYDAAMAKKIIAFLQTQADREDIAAVLLLGDGAIIPPSYYFHIPYLDRQKVPDVPYNEWIASDLLYASPDLDLDIEWAVGRIAVDTPEQALAVAEKLYRWNMENLEKQPVPFLFFSGNIRQDVVYSGELLYEMFEHQGIVGSRAKHYFESDGRYTVRHLRDSLQHEPAGIHYIFTHGSGDGFEIDGDYLYSHQIAAMPYKSGLPLIVSPSCVDGGFDFDLTRPPHDRDGYSIGEAVLRSEGAGIGFLGSTRVSLGQFHYTMDEGLIHPEDVYYRYMPGLLNDFLRAWKGGKRLVADAYVEAHRKYRQRFERSNIQDFATLVELSLLADPVTRLPAPPEVTPADLDHLRIISAHRIKQRAPFVPPEMPATFVLQASSPHLSASATVVETNSGKILHEDLAIHREKPFSVVPRKKSSYLIRLDFPDNTVNWQFFQSGASGDF